MYLLFSSTERRTDKGALDMCCDVALANYLFCLLSHFKAEVTYVFPLVLICLTFDPTLFKW